MSESLQRELILKDVTYQVLAAAYEVHNILGHGFLENIYEKALLKELNARGLKAESQKGITVTYKNEEVGSYYADILVNGEVILELKAVDNLSKTHEAQLLNYLKASGRRVGLLINFGKQRVEHKRMVL